MFPGFSFTKAIRSEVLLRQSLTRFIRSWLLNVRTSSVFHCVSPTTSSKSSMLVETGAGGHGFVSQGLCHTTDGCCWEGICYCLLPACSPPALDHPATQHSLYFVGGHFLKQMEHTLVNSYPRALAAHAFRCCWNGLSGQHPLVSLYSPVINQGVLWQMYLQKLGREEDCHKVLQCI